MLRSLINAVAPAILLLVSNAACAPTSLPGDTNALVEGGTITGFVDATTPLTRQYLGIPYAQKPLGNLRFMAPQPIKSFTHLPTRSLPPSCMQYLPPPAPGSLIDLVPEFNLQGKKTTGAISEDCLYLSVWTPLLATPLSKLPVLVFVHGGAFLSGGIDVPYQKPAQWVQRTQSHIVVTFNYRLGAFGWPDGLGVDNKNLGMLDQRAAVEWVKRNIAALGGDPSKIVLWGQSAGAIGVARYAYAWAEDPIVSGLIMDSGSDYLFAARPATTNATATSFYALAQRLGCGGLPSTAEVACLQAVPAATLETQSLGLIWAPIADNKVVFPNSAPIASTMAKIPAIIGINDNEGAAPNSDPNTSSLVFECAATKTTADRIIAGVETFRYLYRGNFSNVSPTPWMGAYHSSELPLLFGTHPNYRGPSTSLEYATSYAMQDAWVALARGGAQRLKQQMNWQPYTAATRNVRNFGAGAPVADGLVPDLTALCALVPPIQV